MMSIVSLSLLRLELQFAYLFVFARALLSSRQIIVGIQFFFFYGPCLFFILLCQ